MNRPEMHLAEPGGLTGQPLRLYQKVAKRLLDDLKSGAYAVGDRMPSERELAKECQVSRPVVREAVLALEVLGYVEVRIGSGAYVVRLHTDEENLVGVIGPLELMHARQAFEGEAAALAASQITDAELDTMAKLVDEIEAWIEDPEGADEPDRIFHLVIARATRNLAIQKTIDELWEIRATAPECGILRETARAASVEPVVKEHRRILDALRARDADAARAAMRDHMARAIERVEAAIEEQSGSRG